VAAALTVVRGTNDKPAASESLASDISSIASISGELFIGYPIIGTASGRHPIDAVLVSPTHGVVVFDLVDGTTLGDYQERQDDAATKLQSRLLTYKELVTRRKLLIDVHTVTYAPALATRRLPADDEYLVANAETLSQTLSEVSWTKPDPEVYGRAISALQSISTIRRNRGARSITQADSRGAKLQHLEASIATLDSLQSKAVIETVDGVQRIRGLAGSGKTIVLALKAAYLHAQHPDWRIAITFNTRSLKGHFNRLINNFVIEQTGEEPNWENLRILNAWGAPGGASRDGVYHQFCAAHGAEYLDFNTARERYGREEAFPSACAAALAQIDSPRTLYDVLLVDEAQDLPPDFLRLCYAILDDHKRLVYAYDELQNLSGEGVLSAEELFGFDAGGEPRVSFSDTPSSTAPRRDIILEKCYRNSRPVLVTAHGLGFGIYRPRPKGKSTGLVQMFGESNLWTDIGYRIKSGALNPGESVILERTVETSPPFLEAHSPTDDLIVFRRFDSVAEQAEWIASEVESNLEADDLRHDDIMIINPDPVSARRQLGPVRKALLDRGIMSHLAGVDTAADIFFRADEASVTCTGIYRAKGNEAAMVYVLNAHDCHSDSANLARVRNRLFTAITRSKSWVRVSGIGGGMEALEVEYEAIRDADFELRFRYPTAKERVELQVVHRDMSQAERTRVRSRQDALAAIVDDLAEGKIFREDLDPETVERLRDILRDEG